MKKNMIIVGIVTGVLIRMAVAASDVERPDSPATLGTPFWNSKNMENEPVLFVQAKGMPVASGKLLFIPSAKPVIMDPSLAMKYEEGKDYEWKAGTDTIELTVGSRLPFKTLPFAELLKRKEFSDLSGNNYNHPNDFTHRLYAQVMCALFTN